MAITSLLDSGRVVAETSRSRPEPRPEKKRSKKKQAEQKKNKETDGLEVRSLGASMLHAVR